jgi:hypothetical protein
MKTIEERAKAFCENNICVTCGDRKNCDRKCLGTCIPTYDALEWLIQFGKSEHTGLTRWHDPKYELPEYYKVVEVKWYGSGLIRISTAWLSAGDAGGYLWTIEGTSRLINVKNILGWREIHE